MINRNGLRTAFTAGLGNAFASLSGVGDSQYVSLAVLAVSTGTYGGALALGSQRLLGTALGSVLLLIGYEGLRGLPMPLALALTLGALRLLGGLLKLQVGYKVGGIVIVMGWLVHEGGLAAWIPLRFFWTSFGVLITLLGLRLFWPARGLDTSMTQVAGLLGQLQSCFCDLAARVDPAAADQGEGADPIGISRYRALRNQLIAIRGQRPVLLQELGTLPERHPATLLMANFEATASRLITLVGGLVREPPSLQDPQLVVQLHRAEAELLQAMASQLGRWERQIRIRRGLPKPPDTGLQLPLSWQELDQELNDPTANTASLERLERIASRLMLCRQAEQAIRNGEGNWLAILDRS
ncbi:MULTISPECIES: FUSC family protein [unclassified Cyanobium]|uniref:FUSC family protein n=1 Tax=unclassified Cyanobium TaxID=2627006 RepID=UPI0020CF511C|nr:MULTISPECIES: FUSC family protein [unclassified Cyanobium]MCP9777281.1 FUSC family protein [Cyanobium sp. Tous-M-B4]MCP9875654.1 FUSC family protein [Cyanobium sp. A2C-AMD]